MLIVFIFILLVVLISFFQLGENYRSERNKIVHVDIYMNQEIDSLQSIQFIICDSSYFYSNEIISDTICENLAISDLYFPCKVKVIYLFNNEKIKEIVTDEFNCAGCSGTNTYILEKNSVVYEYSP